MFDLLYLFPLNLFLRNSFSIVIFTCECSSLTNRSGLPFLIHMVESWSELMKVIYGSQYDFLLINTTNKVIWFQAIVLNHFLRFESKFCNSMIYSISIIVSFLSFVIFISLVKFICQPEIWDFFLSDYLFMKSLWNITKFL